MYKYLCYNNVNSVILTKFSCDLLYVLYLYRSRKSEISRFFTYIEVLNLLRGSVSMYKTLKYEFISESVQNRK